MSRLSVNTFCNIMFIFPKKKSHFIQVDIKLLVGSLSTTQSNCVAFNSAGNDYNNYCANFEFETI